MDSLQERAALFKGYQKRFRLEVTRFSALEETHGEIKAKAGVWETRQEWETMAETWSQVPFAELNAEELTNSVTKLTKQVFAYKKLLPENEVRVGSLPLLPAWEGALERGGEGGILQE